MTVRIEKSGPVWTVIHSRPEARNAMDPESAAALYDAFLAFDADDEASIAVFWGEGGAFCAGWDLKHAAALDEPEPLSEFAIPRDGGEHGNGSDISMGAMGPSRLELDKPVIAAVAGPAVAGGMELAMWADFRVMEENAYMGVYCRRWGIPFIDGGKLPRGCNRMGWAPDGSLFVGHTRHTWAGSEGISRIEWNGETPFEVRSMNGDSFAACATHPRASASQRVPPSRA